MRSKDPQKIEKIFSAALQLVLREGFSGLKMSLVAQQAGVATGTLYIYFQTKDELINQLYMDLKKRNVEKFMAGYRQEDTFMAGFEQIWRNYFRAVCAHPEENAFLEQYYRSPFLREDVKFETYRLLSPVYELLERGKRERLLKEVPVEIMVAQLSGSIQEIARLWVEGGWSSWQDLEQIAMGMAWDSLKR